HFERGPHPGRLQSPERADEPPPRRRSLLAYPQGGWPRRPVDTRFRQVGRGGGSPYHHRKAAEGSGRLAHKTATRRERTHLRKLRFPALPSSKPGCFRAKTV